MKTKRVRFRALLPGIGWFVLMCVLFFLPGDDLPKTDWWLDGLHIDKIVHFFLFFVLITLLSVPILKSSISHSGKLRLTVGIALLAIVFGLATEFIQKYFVAGRSFDLWDWAADSFGVLLALYVIQRIKTAFPD